MTPKASDLAIIKASDLVKTFNENTEHVDNQIMALIGKSAYITQQRYVYDTIYKISGHNNLTFDKSKS